LDEPVRGSAADPAVLALPGIEQVRALLDGRLAEPPNARLTGRRLLEVRQGSVVFSLPASAWLLGPKAKLHPGVLALLGDSATAGAVITALPPGVLFVTAELSMTFLADMPGAGGELFAEASVVHVDDRHALATTEIREPAGTLLGFGTSRVFLERPMDTSRLGTLSPLPPEPDWPTPDPWARPLDRCATATESQPNGPESLRRTADGLVSRPPIDRLLGIRLVEAAAAEATFTMPASPWLTNEFGAVSGGMLALLAKSATAAAGQAAARPGSTFRALDVKVNFIRGVPPDGQDIIARGRVSHRGQLTVASAVIEHNGLTVALATGSTMLGS
jgi:acyl-CoA thioesterase